MPERAKAAETGGKPPASSAVSGLFLLQFKGAPGAEERAQVAAAGVDLLRYVPEDTFIARFHKVQLASLRALPFVEWVGEYRPEHKVHKALAQGKGGAAAAEPVGVAVLLAPGLSPAEVGQARGMLKSLQQHSKLRSGTVLRGQLSPERLEALSRLDSVLWIESARPMKLLDEVASKFVAGDGGQNTLLAQSMGYDGTGVTVAVADSGLNNGDAASMHPDLQGRTPAFFHYGALSSAADEHSHGTHVAGIIAGNGATGETDENGALYGLGVAPGSSIIAQRIFDGVGNYEAPANGFSQLTRDATDAGAVIGSNSWGDDTQGRYDTSAMEFDELVRDATGSGTNNRPYILEFSAGNAGPGERTMDSPAVAKNVIATGACENDRPDLLIWADGPDAMADFSSRGPCEDGRIKPDLTAPGTWIASLQSASATDENAWLAIDGYYQYQGGTSQAGPHVSGAAAVFVQWYRQTHAGATPSPALVKAALINAATDMDDSFGTAPVPNTDEGWGRVDLVPFLDSFLAFELLEQSTLLTNSQVFEHHVLIASPEEPLKITLAYTDVPGFPGAFQALVNDLDLEVVAPDGTLYRGNQFYNGESVPNPSGPDALNNVEAVHLGFPEPGEYVIRVRARNVVQDVLGGSGTPRQDFALVVSGLIPALGSSTVILDRAAYTAPGKARITVIDADQVGHPSLSVLARSTTEASGETVLLTPAGFGGSFTGAIATATGPAVADGRLQVAHGDTLEVTYADASAGMNRIATARVDLRAPVVQGVFAANSFGLATISWLTDEPATSGVRYGTNPALTGMAFTVTNADLVTDHSLSVGGLVRGVTYYFSVASSDEAGNTASTNSTGTNLFSFVAAPTAPVLLVDEYQDDPVLFEAPPLTGYTEALDLAGVKYDVWNVLNQGPPTNVLQSYRAVIWRVQEVAYAVPALWTPAERLAISNYVQHGGGLFVASMEVLTRLQTAGDENFMHNVLQVQSFVDDEHNSTLAAEVFGSPYESIGNGMDLLMDYSPYDAVWGGLLGPDISDTFTPMPGATPVFRNDYGHIVGLRWPAIGQQAPGRVVFFSFPFDAVPLDPATAGVNDRVALLRNILSFLAPGSSGLASVTLNSPAYTLPSQVGIEVGDANKAGHGTLTVNASSTTQTNGITVTLRESANRGIFTGSFQLIGGATPVNGKLLGKNGDTLRVAYFDAASNSVVLASASVETTPPVITDVVADADYQQATIYWDTSKPADALVQFSESPLLERSAYNSEIALNHEVVLPNLKPNQTYYYRVLSRDLAGNTAMDDNHTNLYTLHTLVPLYAPWADAMDAGATNWSVFSGDGVDAEWTLGVPNNGQESSANSPPDAWGSNLNGAGIGYSETFLLSPAVFLPPGRTATLTFWHSYDFNTEGELDIMEYGQLLLVTNNNSTTPLTLAAYSDDFTTEWQEETIDLTPYAGQLVYLVWNYELLSFDGRPRPGWLVDDVSVSVSSALVISNNLWQASYQVSGPTNFSGTGLGRIIPGPPPGQYTIRFSDVPYYATPATQTGTLGSGGTLFFQGDYAFADANSNGIPDSWEQRFFGNVSTNRSRQTDTDGDGMSDYAEFVAGTDPNSPPPVFRLSAHLIPTARCRLEWPSAPGQQYRLFSSTNMAAWTAFSGWMEATGSTMRLEVPVSTGSKPAFFRVQAGATNSPAGLTPSLALSIQRLSNGTMRLSWPAATNRAYRVQSSASGASWTSLTDWFQATNSTLVHPLPPPARGASSWFRVEVQP